MKTKKSWANYPTPSMIKIFMKKNTSTFTQSIFLKDNAKGNTAITGITTGYILLYDIYEALCK